MALASRCLRRTLILSSSFRYLSSFSSISSSSSITHQSSSSSRFPSQIPRNNHHKTQVSSFHSSPLSFSSSSSNDPSPPSSTSSSSSETPSPPPSSSSTLTEAQAAIVSDFLTPQYKCTVPPPTAEDLKELFENGNLTPGLIAYFEEDPFEEKIKEPPPDLPPFFEGCDYNHWLITMGFPKDSNLTAEEKVETYVQTCANVFGSVEEAKKRMYACSTTTYTGFQVEMTQEMSEKFKNLPGVQFVLPDCYIDPVNKQYGGDQYINGKIIPRPLRKEGSTQEDGNNSKPQQNHAPPQKYVQNSNRPGDGKTFGTKPNYPQRAKFGASPIGRGNNRDSMPKGDRDYAHGKRDNYQGERRDAVTVSRRDSVPAENKEVPGDGASGEQAGH